MALTTPPAAIDLTAPPLIVGPLTVDVFDGARLPGGVVSYAARAAQALGRTARILTVAGPEADTSALDGHEVEVVRADVTLTFEHGFDETGTRSLRVIEAAGHTLTAADLPAAWGDGPPPPLLILAPLLPGDVDVASFGSIAPREVIALVGQGMQRERRSDGAIENAAKPTPELLEACALAGTLFLSDEDTAEWSSGELERVAASLPTMIVTRGADGADVFRAGVTFHIDAAPADTVDTTGAGDVFATTYMFGVAAGMPRPGRLAAALAAAATELAGPERLPSWGDIAVAAGRPSERSERGSGR